MSRRAQQRAQEKARLLSQIQQQRIDLASEKKYWLATTAHYDHYWQRVMEWRRYWLIASGAVALYGIRHPNRLIRWVRRGVGVWSIVNLGRKSWNR